jgi:ADP-ribose pyrophosphatase YjhB (NUDIX family)
MSQLTLEERVAALEKKVVRLSGQCGLSDDPGRDPSQTLENRVTALEQLMERITNRVTADETLPRKKDWRRTIGMFANDPIMKEIDEETRKIREADRDRARRKRKTRTR